MYCQRCGKEIPDNTIFCPYCSAEQGLNYPNQTAAAPVQPAPVNPYANDPQASADASPVLVWGILGIAFASSFYLSFLGIIFSAIGRSKANAYLAKYGMVFGKSKVGSILSKVGLILGIVMTVFLILYIIALVAMIKERVIPIPALF